MKVLVTGGAGFIGSNIVDRLISKGYEVVIIDDMSTGELKNINPKATFYQIDIQSDAIEDIFREEMPDYLNHHAAQIDVRKSVANPLFDAKINILGTINLLQNCVKYGVKKVIFASSGGAIYGEQRIFPAPETHIAEPMSPYGITKLIGEKYLYYYYIVHKLKYLALRYGNVYGPRQNPCGEAGVIAVFTNNMLENKQSIINGDGKQTRDYVYVDDIVDANYLAMEKDVVGAFNIGTGKETDVNQIFHLLRRTVNVEVEEIHGQPKEGEQLRSLLECSKAKWYLDWSPKTSLEEGIQMTVAYYRKVAQAFSL